MPELTTACPRNCYSTCAMRAVVEDGRLVALRPHPGNRATADGPCLKGLSYVERVASPDRVLHPPRRSAFGTSNRPPEVRHEPQAGEKQSKESRQNRQAT